MIVSINQPAYLPWLGYFERIIRSDIHVVLDSVQFEKNSMINRNKIRTKEGWSWLSVPVKTKGLFGNLNINEINISTVENWQRKHWNALSLNYSKAPFFNEHQFFFNDLYQQKWESLNELIKKINLYLLDILNIKTKILYSSDFNLNSKKDLLILDICKSLNATTYISGAMGRNYIDEQIFISEKINILYQDYKHPEYRQVYENFIPFMSIIDLIFNEGPNSQKILMSNND
jgi:hypothetical protein